MPELPEVETVICGLSKIMAGQVIVAIEIRCNKLRWPIPDNLSDTIAGIAVKGIRRRGKYIIIELANKFSLLIHLGMSGSFRIIHPSEIETNQEVLSTKHEHFVIVLDSGIHVAYRDPRRFGMLDIAQTSALNSHRLLRQLGPEPFGIGFNVKYLTKCLDKRSISIKAALLDQTIVAGVGNIYASESLWLAGISPVRKCSSIKKNQLQLLVKSVCTVLNEAIEAGGSTLRNYKSVYGELGGFQDRFNVYDRAMQPCNRHGCSGTIIRIVQSGRSTFFCNICQL